MSIKNNILKVAAVAVCSVGLAMPVSAQQASCCEGNKCETNNLNNKTMNSIYDFTTSTSRGKEFNFADLKGKVIVVVNTASKCGFTPEFSELEALYQKYKDQGLCIVGFPSGDFADQELENGEKAEEFCQLNYGVTFPIMKKVHVNGDDVEPIFTYLKNEKGFQGLNKDHKYYSVMVEMFNKNVPGWEQSNDIKWNFTKFLIGRDGKVVNRYETTVDNAVLDAAIAQEIAR